jgi:membrane fusion protein (multidrug efflux system)
VKLGPSTGSDYVVSAGLEAGDRVVVEGLQKIRDGMVVKPVPVGAAKPEGAAEPAPPAAEGSK